MLKPIPNFEMYLADEKGAIYSFRKNTPMKYWLNNKGYAVINLIKNNKKYRSLKVHRLIASTFLPNPENLPQVNHKDENKLNNCVENLEWCDNKYNSNYGTRNERIINARKIRYSRPILQINKKGEILAEYRCAEDTKKYGFQPSNIRNVLNGKRKYANGYHWAYKEGVI